MVVANRASVPRVIVMDDDAKVLKAVSRLLAAMGLDAIPAPSCAAARDAAAQVWPDLIVADWMLGDGDGVVCASELKARYGCAALVYSAEPRPAGAVAGIDGWVCKPGEAGELDSTVQTLLARRNVNATPPSTSPRLPAPTSSRMKG